MIKAEQQALIHEANKHLLIIRRDELQYFVAVFSDFGMMASLLAGFTVSILTQVDTLGSDVSFIWKWLFWLSCIVVMIATLHVILTTTFINIFGPGLALRGPPGSMVRAVDGMVKEMDAVCVVFFLSVIVFQLATLACSFVVMYESAAWTCFVIFIAGLYMWYVYCLRIYNRFKIQQSTANIWSDSDNGPEKDPSMLSRLLSRDSYGVFSEGDVLSNSSRSTKETKKRKTMLQQLFDTPPPRHDKGLGASLLQNEISPSPKVRLEGYLAKKVSTSLLRSTWTRYYFLLQGEDLYYYTSKESYLLDPKRPVLSRPLVVSSWAVLSSQEPNGDLTITLTPAEEDDERSPWYLKVDTLAEYESWVKALTVAGAHQPIDGSVVHH